jgi:xanthine/uracil permease
VKRHGSDPVSLMFGIFLGVIALIFLFADVDVTRIDQPWVWALPVLIIGLLLASVGFRMAKSYSSSPDGYDDATSDEAETDRN